MTPSGLINIREAAEYIGVSDKTIRRYIARGMITPTNISAGRFQPRWAIGVKEMDAFIARRTQKPEYAERAFDMPKPGRRRKTLMDFQTAIPPQGLAPDGLPNYRHSSPEEIRRHNEMRRRAWVK
jgi:excisionase family DNA binding protein